MDIDGYKRKRAIDNVKNAFKSASITMQELFKEFQRIFNLTKVIKMDNKEKQKYKPVLQIRPNRSVLTDKRPKNYYCRSNC